MPTIRNVGTKVRWSVERLDGGYNSKDSPSKISPYESPDCLNVVFDDAGSVWTRDGSSTFNTQTIGSQVIDGAASYNGTMVAWAGGSMYRASGTTFVTVPSAEGKFTSGRKVASVVHQGILFCSDGSNGPWRYHNGSAFYNMGIVTPSACTASGTSAGAPAPGTYYYAVSFVNTQAVEGEIGSASAGVTIAASAVIGLTSIPVGSSLAGVAKRFIYRRTGSSADWRKVGEVSDNTTTTFADNTANDAEGKEPVEDASSPTPFNTITLHKERLFFDDSTNSSLLRYTNIENPYVSEAENTRDVNNQDGESIIAVAQQDDFVQIFKDNNTFSLETIDPADDLSWVLRKNPANIGIVGRRAFGYVDNAIAFVGKRNNRITGLHLLTGLQVVETGDGRLRTKSISEKIEYDVLNSTSSTYWADMSIGVYENRLYWAYTPTSGTRNTRIFWLDLGRVGSEGQPGSWAPWSGIEVNQFIVHNGLLYASGSNSNGFMYRLEAGAYSDSGSAINSYFWTKEIGGEDDGALDSYVKDFREVYLWHEKLGNYNMALRWRLDGSGGSGAAQNISLNPGGSNWGTMVWGVDPWGGAKTDVEVRLPLGRLIGKRIQFRFDNQNTVSQAFKVHRLEVGMNLRRRR